MGARPRNHDLAIDLVVNGRHFQSVQIRPLDEADDAAEDFDVLIGDSQVGSFALADECDLEIRSNSGWNRISLAELKGHLRGHRSFPRLADIPSSSEMAELRFFNQWIDIERPHRMSRHMDWITAQDRCMRRVRAVLGEVAIPCVPCGGVFVVPNRSRARAVLLRAGFLPSTISAGALTESFTGSTVYLLERSQ